MKPWGNEAMRLVAPFSFYPLTFVAPGFPSSTTNDARVRFAAPGRVTYSTT
jgi:hypothetical protein